MGIGLERFDGSYLTSMTGMNEWNGMDSWWVSHCLLLSPLFSSLVVVVLTSQTNIQEYITGSPATTTNRLYVCVFGLLSAT